jgi:hypothetical protein
MKYLTRRKLSMVYVWNFEKKPSKGAENEVAFFEGKSV